MLPKRYSDRVDIKSQSEISGPGGSPLQLDVMLSSVLLNPAHLSKLSDDEIEALRTAIPKLAAPAVGVSGVVDAEFTDVTEIETEA
jgi:hypothetical protein